jgi:primosomal protein N'
MSSPLFDGLAPAAPNDATDERVVRVALPVPTDRLFDYRVPDTLEGDVEPGMRVRVDFGGQVLIGIVVPRDWQTDEDAARPGAPVTLAAIGERIDE